MHKAIWGIADDLRGSVDGWDFKQYILGIMFYRYISENITNYINEGERKAGEKTFDYANLSDREAETARDELVQTKGFFILPSELFCNICKKAKDYKENLNEILEKIFNNIEKSAKGAESEDDFSGLFADIDVNSNKLGATVSKRNEKLIKILDGIASINLGKYQDNQVDAFGDAYEFLMSMYASNAGKSGGEFFTPQEVSELLTRLAIVGKTSVNKVYDPACGSSSLLLKSAKILGKDNVRNGFYGQEINLTTYNLCRINMFLHDIGYDKFNIACEDTLISPQHWDDEPFEVIVSNPPYSIIGTSIATCIMVLKKNKKDSSTLFIDAAKECVKVTNNNKLKDNNIDNIVKIFTDRIDKEYIAKLVPNKEIEENDYNLSVSTYVEKEDTREKIDIVELNKEIEEIVAREDVLREEISKIISEIEV